MHALHAAHADVDEINYRAELKIYIRLTWKDPRASAARAAATAAALDPNTTHTCAYPCSTIYHFTPTGEGTKW